MDFRFFTKADVQEASVLLAARHRRERAAFPSLKARFEDPRHTGGVLSALLERENAAGICAYENGAMAGFLLSHMSPDGMLGRCGYISYEGMATGDAQRPELYRQLYAELSKIWLKHGALFHYAEVPAGCRETVEAWLGLSFAYQQVYGVRALSKAQVILPDRMVIRQAAAADADVLRKHADLICAHQASAPTFAPAPPEYVARIRDGYEALPGETGSIILVAYEGDRFLGFQCADTEDNPSAMMRPERAYELSVAGTVAESRGSGVGSLLTQAVMNRAVEAGYENALAAWRIANLLASAFWPKHGFQPIAYRMHRRIDERVYWADGIAGR